MKFGVVFVILFSLAAHADYVQNYDYLLSDTLKSTVASSKIVAPATAISKTLKLKIFDRKENRSRSDLKIRVFPGTTSKVVFVVVGLGGNIDTPMGEYLASVIQTQGSTAILLPNSMTAEFATGASSTGLVGDPSRDAADTYKVMQVAIQALPAAGIQASEFALTGYSLGALVAARVEEIDSVENKIGLKSALLINPPVNLLRGMKLLDQYYAQFKSMGLGSLMGLANKVKKFLAMLVGAPAQADSVNLSQRELEGAIGYSMRSTFAKMVLATQNINDLGVLPDILEERDRAAKKIGFEDYVTNFLGRAIGSSFSLEALNVQSSLTAQSAYLSRAQNVFVLHNANDFLLTPEDVQWVETTFTRRARIYPTGGHMGNLDHADNVQAIQKWLAGNSIN